jgi:hypothetical protein
MAIKVEKQNIEVISGSLLRISFNRLNAFFEASSGSSVSPNDGGIPYNTDGSNSGIYCNIAAGGYGVIWFFFYGRTLGIRFQNTADLFTVSVDGGDAVRVTNPEDYLTKEGRANTQYHEVMMITHQNLDDGIHFGRIVISGGNNFTITGLMVEECAGYKNYVVTKTCAVPDISNVVVPSTSPDYVRPYDSSSTSLFFRWVSKAIYSNPTANPITLQWFIKSTSTVCLSKVIAAGDTFILDFNIPIGTAMYRHQASSEGLVVLFTGGYF